MANKTCPICKSPLKVIPAGVAKMSGKPYPAFYSCPKRCNIRDMIDTRVESAPQGWSKPSLDAKFGATAIPVVEDQPKSSKVDSSVILADEISALRLEVKDLIKFLHEQLGSNE